MSDITTYITDGASRDEVIIRAVSEGGMSLNAATKAYAEYAREHGLTRQTTSHKEAALDRLRELYGDRVLDEGAEAVWTADTVRDEVIEMAAEYEVVESTARDYAKAFSEELGVAHPTSNPRERMFQFLIDMDARGVADKEAFMEFAVGELGRSRSNANEYWKGYELHLAIVAARG